MINVYFDVGLSITFIEIPSIRTEVLNVYYVHIIRFDAFVIVILLFRNKQI